MKPPTNSPGHKSMQESTTYEVKCKCENCGWHQDIEIERGQAVRDHIHDIECNYCGCKELKQKKS